MGQNMAQDSQAAPVKAPATSWSYNKTLCFLSVLLEARRKGRFNPSAFTYSQQDLEGLIALLDTRYPGHGWELSSVEDECYQMRAFWGAFKEAKDLPGSAYHADTGKLTMSEDLEDWAAYRCTNFGIKSISSGLPIGHGITLEIWQEIFSDSPPTKSKENDNVADVEDATSTIQVNILQDAIVSQPLEEGSKDAMSASDTSDESLSSQASTLSPSTRTMLPGRTGTLSNVIQGRKKRSKRREETRLLLDALNKATDALLAREPQIVTLRPAGADDVEKAVKDCFLLTEERGVAFVARLVKWVSSDPMNAVLWNALPTKEAKDAYMPLILPEDTFRLPK